MFIFFQLHGESSGEQPIESLPKRRRIDNAQLSAVLSEPDVNVSLVLFNSNESPHSCRSLQQSAHIFFCSSSSPVPLFQSNIPEGCACSLAHVVRLIIILSLIFCLQDLHGALKKSLPGLLVLGFFKAHSHLDDYSRDLLSQQTLYRELESDYNGK